MLDVEYVVPLKATQPVAELADYLQHIATYVDVTVVDGSPPAVFAANARRLGSAIRHVGPTVSCPNGKVAGVCTGMRIARHDKAIIADDDVRYRPEQLRRVAVGLDSAEVVRPQNYFVPLPWHARWDTARTLLNRAGGGDYPGTLGVRLLPYLRMHGYDGTVLFENLELIRTVRALGGREAVLLDCYVARRPPNVHHFLGQRVRQAYDSLAQPARLVAELCVLPVAAGVLAVPRARPLGAALITVVLAGAEYGRRRAGGSRWFPRDTAAWVVPWLLERGCCAWCAVYLRARGRGVRFGDTRLLRAATPPRGLRQRAALVANSLR